MSALSRCKCIFLVLRCCTFSVLSNHGKREREPRMSARGDHGRKFLLLYPRRGVFPASKLTYLRLGCNSWEHNTPLLRRCSCSPLLPGPSLSPDNQTQLSWSLSTLAGVCSQKQTQLPAWDQNVCWGLKLNFSRTFLSCSQRRVRVEDQLVWLLCEFAFHPFPSRVWCGTMQRQGAHISMPQHLTACQSAAV